MKLGLHSKNVGQIRLRADQPEGGAMPLEPRSLSAGQDLNSRRGTKLYCNDSIQIMITIINKNMSNISFIFKGKQKNGLFF
jgi:hypothetical protein